MQRVTETQNTIKLTDRMWARLLASTNQPSFLNCDETVQGTGNKAKIEEIDNMKTTPI